MRVVIMVFTVFPLLLSFTTSEAKSNTVDSLSVVIREAEHDTSRIDALNWLGWEIMYDDPDSSIVLGNRALKLCEKGNSYERKANTLRFLGVYYWIKSEFSTALDYMHQSLAIQEAKGDLGGAGATYNNIGGIYYKQSNYPQALEYYFKALSIYSQEGFGGESATLANIYNNIGGVYYNQGDYDNALENYLISQKIDIENGNREGLIGTYNNMGIIYRDESEYDKALEYYNKSIKIRKETGYNQGLGLSYSNIGQVYLDQYDDGHGVDLTPNEEVALLDSALHYQKKALAASREKGNEWGMTFGLNGMADVYLNAGEFPLAIEYYSQGASIADSIGAIEQSSMANEGLVFCYEELGEFELALKFYKRYTTLQDSTFNEEKSKDIGKLEAKHEFEKAEAEQKRLHEAEMARQKQRETRRDNLQYSGILIVIVALFAGVFSIGRLAIPIRLAEGVIFFTFLLLFEFTLVLLDPYIESYSGGAPALKLAFNAVLAAFIFPLHSFFESKLRRRIVK